MPNTERQRDDVVTKASPRSVEATVARLTSLIEAKGMQLFAVIDQRAAARAVGMQLRPTTLVVFGSPAAGTPIMDAVPLAALDLPLKVLVWAERDGDAASVAYEAPDSLAVRLGLPASLAANLAGVGPLTDALVAADDDD